MIELLAWAFILRKKRGKRVHSRVFAESAGLFAWAVHFDAVMREKDSGSVFGGNLAPLKELVGFLLEFDGLARLSRGGGWLKYRRLLLKYRQETIDVFRLVDFMLRNEVHSSGVESTIENAKRFLSKRYKRVNKHRPKVPATEERTLQKRWDHFRPSAMIIYSVYRNLKIHLCETTTMAQLTAEVHHIMSDPHSRARLLGEAAYAADVLAKTARKVPTKYFKDIPRVVPPLRPFNKTELELLRSLDPNEAIYSAPFRAASRPTKARR